MPSHTLVVARYKEDVSWVERVPDGFRVAIYNKGGPLPPLARDGVEVIGLENVGREAETYLRHLMEHPPTGVRGGYTVFCQGDPFEHSPDFLDLLGAVPQWRPVQPLSWRWKPGGLYEKHRNFRKPWRMIRRSFWRRLEQPAIPPEDVLRHDVRSFVSGLRVRLEVFSLYSMAPVHFRDPGAYYIANIYRSEHGLGEAANLSQDFLERCGLPELAASAASHHLGQFAYGGHFAAANAVLAGLSADAVSQMHRVSTTRMAAYMFERHWLHFFGLPFQFPDRSLAWTEPPGTPTPVAQDAT